MIDTGTATRATLVANEKPRPTPDPQLREVAQKLEAQFLAEMLSSAGLGRPSESLNGGIGEEQFSSFLVQAYAAELSRAGGIGLAAAIEAAMERRS
ncbi:rod-binding protein [Halodurantibacterium flavum]|uniref:Rod-binding protein n=2 Tax=Halodurantibacterium flavum TaxID=1382802 RepID=A0ABW4S831_9RHOB